MQHQNMQNILSFATFRPTEAERKAILEEIATLKEHKRQVLESTQRVEARVLKLKQERVGLEKEKTRKVAQISAIRWVPFEVLGYIFEQCFEDSMANYTYSTYPNNHSSNSSTPLPTALYTLGHTTLIRLQLVSKAWYYVVKSSPRLWTRLDLVGPFHLHNLHIHRGQIDSHALHSGRLPLRVTFWNGVDIGAPRLAENGSDRIDAINRLLGYLILRTSDRWTSFDLRCLFIYSGWQKPFELRSVYRYIFSRAAGLRHLVLHEDFNIHEFRPYFPPNQRANRDGFLSLLCSYYGKNKAAILETMDLFDIPLVLQPDLSPLHSVRELSIGFTQDMDWGLLIEDTFERSWLSLFPRLRKLTLNCRLSAASNAFRHSLRVRGQTTPWEEISDLICVDEYKAEQLEELCLQGYAPLFVLHNVTLPALKTIRIEANRQGAHTFKHQRHREWGMVGPSLGAVQTLYLLCSYSSPCFCTCRRPCSCSPPRHYHFWDTLPESYPYDEGLWHAHQENVRGAFAPFLNLEMVYAPSCVYRRLIEVFGSIDMNIGMEGEGEDDQGVDYDQEYGKYEKSKDKAGVGVRHSELLALSGDYLRRLLKEQVEEEEYYEGYRDLDPYNSYNSYHSGLEHQEYEGA